MHAAYILIAATYDPAHAHLARCDGNLIGHYELERI
jgi:hypothetical protein